MSFAEQIKLSIFDKLLLGILALVVANLLNRSLELFRARRALEGEFLRERTRRLDELYVVMLDVEAAGREYVDLELERIEIRKGGIRSAGFITATPNEIAFSQEKFREASRTLMRKAAHYRPWISDRLQALCAEYGKVVGAGVIEQTVDGSHDIDRIGHLEKRTSDLQNAIVSAIREGAPPKAV